MSLSKKPKVVIDTNVFISGILYGGNAEKILGLFKDAKIEVIISPETLNELLIKLAKFEVEEKLIEDLYYILDTGTIKVLPTKKVTVARDKKDNMFLALAWESKADYLVTGDKDLLILKNYERTLIVSPKKFLEIMKIHSS